MRRSITFICSLLVLVMASGVFRFAWGQEVTAAIVGAVTDPSGAAVSGVTVVAKDTERGVEYTTKTNESGGYTLTRIPVGTYQLTASAQGFQTAKYPPFTLVLNQTARIDIKLTLGQVSETVEVSTSAPVLQTENTQVSTILDSRSVEDLALVSRNYVELTLLTPGSVSPNPTNFHNGDNTANGARPYINGNREQANNFVLDGLDNNQVSDNLLGFTPAPDAIQEFNVITNNASAEFGNFMGGIVNTTIKSGTNSFHGDLWEYLRNDVLNANSWENNFNQQPRKKQRWNMFGGAVGGPIVKNKLFFFFDYQMQRYDYPAASQGETVFTTAERAGDFGALCPGGFDASGVCLNGIQLYNPCSVTTAPCTASTFVTGARTPFPKNVIPLTMINPVASALFASSEYPTPVNANTTGSNAFNTVTQAFNNSQFDIKGDFNATANDHIFGRYSHAHQDNPLTNSFPIFGNSFAVAPINNYVLDWSHAVNSAMVNDVRVGVNYVKLNNGSDFPSSIGNLGTDLGIANANPLGPGLFQLGFNGGTPSQPGSGNLTNVGSIGIEQNFRNAVIQFSDGLVLTRGHHEIHTGFEFWRDRINIFYTGNSGRFGGMFFGGNFTSDNPGNPTSKTGFGGADFFLGLPNSYGTGISTGGWGQRSSVFAGYVQDNWRVTSALTLNLGLRYEAHTPWVERDNRQVNVGLFSGQIIAPNCSLVGNIPFSCQNSTGALYNGSYGLPAIQPRLGFAWSPGDRKTVLRGAFTVSSYLEGTGTNLRLPINPPFSPAETLTQFKGTTYPTPTEAGIIPPAASGSDPFAGALIRVWDPHVQPAVSDQWNVTVQRELNSSTTAQVGYVGQHGTHLMVPMPYAQKQLLPNSACATPPCTAPSIFLAGNPALQNDISQISGTASVGSMNYNALQAVLQKRYGNGLQYQVAYTYSKCRTDNSGYYGTWGSTQAGPANPYYQNLYDPRADWAPCYMDVSNTLTAYAVYDIPFGRGKKYGSNVNGALNAIAGGWTVSPLVSVRGGFPLALYDFGTDVTGTGSRGLRPDCNGANHVFGRKPATSGGQFIGYQWYDPTPYSAPAVGQFGTCPAQGPIRGPGYADVDLSLQKNFYFTETLRLQFRADFVNTFNHVNLNLPADALGTNMGLINTSQDPRNIQFALKFYF
ncbi:MAG TPA: TonB-dependent receptor [Candidatus Sulfotelmatobacter sp.]|nr:TonB-dependent receptor [Candidatus Sulfotelmatobacter sp.]